MNAKNLLGEYLKARRQLVAPEAVGLPRGIRRRVPGLRREEVALLAGISPDYYLRLEQGRDQNPSGQVLDALAVVLDLDGDATACLHQLAGPTPRRHEKFTVGGTEDQIMVMYHAEPGSPSHAALQRLAVTAGA